jgi:CRISPR-associated protein Cmr2
VSQLGNFMLMFSLGPVQPFIAQARKTRDLWLGSFFLSVLMEAGMKSIEQALVYPTNPTIEGDISDLPNKFVAIFKTATAAKAGVDSCTEQIVNTWNTICQEIWKNILYGYEGTPAEKIWERQIDTNTLFDIFWVIVEREAPEGYAQWLKRTEEIFDARKRLRDFLRQNEEGEKSTISGEREALRGDDASRYGVRDFWATLSKRIPANGERFSAKDINQEGAERLDAIDTIKRFALYSPTLRQKLHNKAFPSTSSVATASFVEEMIRQRLDSAALDGWLQATAPLAQIPPRAIPYLYTKAHQAPGWRKTDILERDGDLYFSETFTSKRLKEDYGFSDEAKAKSIAEKGRKALSAFLADIDAHTITRPTPYYAMIQMDGDEMGILLSGVKDDAEHKNISEALSQFSRGSALNLVQEQYPGRLIYAGGDDVFALAPLARDTGEIITVLNLADELRKHYYSTVEPMVSSEKRKRKVTVSAGIAIAHHFTSLSYVRRASKEAEQLAKEHYGRNALVVTVIRRSGEQTRVGCHWHYDELTDEGQPIALVTRFYKMFKDDVLSPKSVFNLLEEAPALVKLEREAQQSELKRVLLRQSNDSIKQKKPDKTQVERLSEHLVHLAMAMDDDERRKQDTTRLIELHSDQRRYGLVEVFGWLLVAAFLARKEQE